ncbi:PREDICTED: reverse mRNAase [Prunus dulcis]|uniref:PREDICTED: reverse mRNAase n=1 Tax=Prunus dulcis TaxID=3755 RepID=A0A5E4GIB4_PRUDU|nr:PREDICTED: reverse mRNAase [Prunus dulcis]
MLLLLPLQRQRLRHLSPSEVDSIGKSGGLCLLWKEEFSLHIRSSSLNHIDAFIGGIGDKEHWRFTGFYGFPAPEDKFRSWQLLHLLAAESTLPWLVVGDFNEIMSSHEKEGGAVRPVRQMMAFREAAADCNLQNLSRSSKVQHLAPSKSDHLPVLVSLATKQDTPRGHKPPFRFESSWVKHEDCDGVVHKAWDIHVVGTPMFQVVEKIKNTRLMLLQWQREQLGGTKREISKIRTQLDDLMRQPLTIDTITIRNLLVNKLKALLEKDEALWRQRSRVAWLKEGDRNSKFFHHGGTWHETRDEIAKVVVDYFQDLFTSQGRGSTQEVLNSIEPRVSVSMNNTLNADFTDEEVKTALLCENVKVKSPTLES